MAFSSQKNNQHTVINPHPENKTTAGMVPFLCWPPAEQLGGAWGTTVSWETHTHISTGFYKCCTAYRPPTCFPAPALSFSIYFIPALSSSPFHISIFQLWTLIVLLRGACLDIHTGTLWFFTRFKLQRLADEVANYIHCRNWLIGG